MIMGGSVVTSCSLHVLLYTCGVCPGLCSLERATKTDKILPVRTYKIGLMQRNPGNRLIHSQRKKNLSACHASYSARIELKPRPTCPDGLPVSAYLAFRRKVLMQRDMFERRRIFYNYTYAYKAPLRGVGCFPRGDASWHATGESYQSSSSRTRSMRVIPKERNI